MKKIIFTAVTALFAMGMMAQTPVVSGPQITIDKEVHNFGNIPYGGNGTCEFKVTNTAQLTREELQSIEASHPLDSTVVHPKMIESMDPPAFTKNILKRTLMIENGDQLEQLMHTMEEKAQVIE